MKDYFEILKARFDALWMQIKAAGFSNAVHPEESKIRLEKKIQAGRTQYVFDLKQENNQIDGVKEVALQRNDVFVPNRLGVFIAIRDKQTGVETLYSYIPVNDGTNPSVHAAGFKNGNANVFFEGSLAWRVGTTVMISGYPMERFKQIPEVQGAFVLDSSDAAVSENIQSEWAIDKAAKLLLPKYTIAGTRDHKLEINLPSYAAELAYELSDANHDAYLVLWMDGFKVVGGCEHINGKNPFEDAVGQW